MDVAKRIAEKRKINLEELCDDYINVSFELLKIINNWENDTITNEDVIEQLTNLSHKISKNLKNSNYVSEEEYFECIWEENFEDVNAPECTYLIEESYAFRSKLEVLNRAVDVMRTETELCIKFPDLSRETRTILYKKKNNMEG